MAKLKLKILDIAALVVTLLGTIFQLSGFFAPAWWTFTSRNNNITVGMLKSTECLSLSEEEIRCTPKTAIDIEGGTEWLFITRIFEIFGCFLVLLALILHLIYLPVRNDNARSPAIYSLGAAGLFILAGSFVFVAMYRNLAASTSRSEQSLGFPVGLCILAGIISIVASVITAIATVKKANQIDDFEYQDEEQMITVPMRK